MSDAIVVTGIGLVSPLGTGLKQAWEALVTGESGIRELAPDDPRLDRTVDPTPLPEVRRAGFVRGFQPREHIQSPHLRRMDWCSRLMVAAATQAVAEAGPGAIDDPTRAAIVVGSCFGNQRETAQYLRRVIEIGPGAGQPFLFPNLVLNAAAGYAAIELGAQGPNLTVSQHEASGEAAIATAVELLELGLCDVVVAGGVDELGSVYLDALRERRLLHPDSLAAADRAKRPRRAGGVIPGEGAAALVLERAERARARGGRPRAMVAAARIGAVAARPYAFPDPEACASRMLDLCGRDSLDSIDAIIGAADGTEPREAIDRAVLAALRNRRQAPIAHLRMKSLVGDWPSAGALAAALAALAIDRQVLPAGEEAPRDLTASPLAGVLVPGAARAGALVPLVLARAR